MPCRAKHAVAVTYAARAASIAVCALIVAGCYNSHPKESADAFLRETLAAYASRPTEAADCTWTATDGHDTFAAMRHISYESPNRYHIETVHDNTLLLASVSDGAQVTEYSNVPGMLAGIYPAPANIDGADSPQMKNPLDCGSPFYAFLAGPAGYGKLVDSSAKPPRYGPDTEIDGVPCVTIVYTEPGGFGEVTAVIEVNSKIVRKLSYNAAGLMASGATAETESAPSSGAPMFQHSLPQKPPSFQVTEAFDDKTAGAKLTDSDWDTSLPESLPPFRLASDSTSQGSSGSDQTAEADLGKPPVPIGSPAPDITVVDARTGNKVKLSSYRGQIVMLDFFASWCMPCRLSLPETQKIYSTHQGRGLTVMGIDGESRAKINEFLASNHYSFPAYSDTDGSASQTYQANAIPTIAIVDKQGRLSFYAVGLQDKSTVDAAVKKAGG